MKIEYTNTNDTKVEWTESTLPRHPFMLLGEAGPILIIPNTIKRTASTNYIGYVIRERVVVPYPQVEELVALMNLEGVEVRKSFIKTEMATPIDGKPTSHRTFRTGYKAFQEAFLAYVKGSGVVLIRAVENVESTYDYEIHPLTGIPSWRVTNDALINMEGTGYLSEFSDITIQVTDEVIVPAP